MTRKELPILQGAVLNHESLFFISLATVSVSTWSSRRSWQPPLCTGSQVWSSSSLQPFKTTRSSSATPPSPATTSFFYRSIKWVTALSKYLIKYYILYLSPWKLEFPPRRYNNCTGTDFGGSEGGRRKGKTDWSVGFKMPDCCEWFLLQRWLRSRQKCWHHARFFG